MHTQGSLIAFPVFISHLGIIFDEGPIQYFPHFFSIYIVYIFLIDFEKLFILYECFC